MAMYSPSPGYRLLSRIADLESALRLRLAHLTAHPEDPRRRVIERHARSLRHQLLVARSATKQADRIELSAAAATPVAEPDRAAAGRSGSGGTGETTKSY